MRRLRPALVLLAACAGAVPACARPAPTEWRLLITTRDNARLKTWRDDFVRALDPARAAGFGVRLDAEGALLQPDAGLETPRPPDGTYRCRLLRLGTKGPPRPGATLIEQPIATGGPAFSVQPPGACSVKDDTFKLLEGVQRPGGRLYAYDQARLVLLGGMALSDERGMVRYGRDPDRNLVGLLERIGERRWRLVLPAPQWQGLVEVVEIVPEAG